MTYLANFETIVDFVFEGSHGDFANQLRVDDRIFNDEWE